MYFSNITYKHWHLQENGKLLIYAFEARKRFNIVECSKPPFSFLCLRMLHKINESCRNSAFEGQRCTAASQVSTAFQSLSSLLFYTS